jgi:hypothetical protein
MNLIQKLAIKILRIETNENNPKGNEIVVLKQEMEQLRTLNQGLNEQIKLYQMRMRDSENALNEYKNILEGKETLVQELRNDLARAGKEKGSQASDTLINEGLGYRKSLIMAKLRQKKMCKGRELLEATGLISRAQLWKLLKELESEKLLLIQGQGNQKFVVLNSEETQIPGHP